MMLEFFAGMFFSMSDWILDFIPDITLGEAFTNGLNSVQDFTNLLGYFFPISTLLICISVIFILDNVKLLISILIFV